MENNSNIQGSLKPPFWRGLRRPNKYLIAVIVFAVIMLFIDKNDYFIQRQRTTELNNLLQSKKYYTDEINKEKATLEKLRYNPASMEKIAREKYLMKKDNEDLFIVNEEVKP